MAAYEEDMWQGIVNVHWPDAGVVVLVDLEGQVNDVTVGNLLVTFTGVPSEGNSITINDVVIVFGEAGQVAIGSDAASSAQNLADYLNLPSHPVEGVTADAAGAEVSLFYDTPKLTLAKSSGAIDLIGARFVEDPPLAEDTVIPASAYAGLALYDPFGNAGAFDAGNDLIYRVYVEIFNPDNLEYIEADPVYVSRRHRAMLVNMALAEEICEIDVFAQNGNNYGISIWHPPAAYPVQLMQPIDNTMTLTAYSAGTEFKVGAGGMITTEATPLWTATNTATVEDTRSAPGNSAAEVNAYNLVGIDPPFPFASLTFNKDGVLSLTVGAFGA